MKTIPYGHHWINEQDIKEVVKVLRSDWITQGPKIKEFEKALCKYTGAKFAVAVSSGTAALHIACLAAGIEPGDEVITTPMTFAASANCILYCGGKPVFVDIQENTANIDPEEIKKKITRKTEAIIPIHFAGHPCDLEEIYRIAQKYNLLIIEDATHALGAQYMTRDSTLNSNRKSKKNSTPLDPNGKWIKIGSCNHSDMAVFSFHPVKHITTGEGGAVLTNNKDLYEQLILFRNHGITKSSSKFTNQSSTSNGDWYYEMQALGFNYRITDIQCALGISQLRKMDEIVQRRREILKIYNQALKLKEYFNFPIEKENVESSWHLCFLKLKNKYKKKKRTVFSKLRKRGLGVQVHYIPVYWHPYYRGLGYKKGLCPKSEEFYRSEISIPLYPSMKNNEVKYVIDTLIDVFEKENI